MVERRRRAIDPVLARIIVQLAPVQYPGRRTGDAEGKARGNRDHSLRRESPHRRPLWSARGRDETLNGRILEWRYSEHPLVNRPFVYLLLVDGETVGMRGFLPSRWRLGTRPETAMLLCGCDLVLDPRHRGKGLVRHLMEGSALGSVGAGSPGGAELQRQSHHFAALVAAGVGADRRLRLGRGGVEADGSTTAHAGGTRAPATGRPRRGPPLEGAAGPSAGSPRPAERGDRGLAPGVDERPTAVGGDGRIDGRRARRSRPAPIVLYCILSFTERFS